MSVRQFIKHLAQVVAFAAASIAAWRMFTTADPRDLVRYAALTVTAAVAFNAFTRT